MGNKQQGIYINKNNEIKKQINELKTNLKKAERTNSNLQLKLNESNELNQNKINELDKKQQGLKLKLTFLKLYLTLYYNYNRSN